MKVSLSTSLHLDHGLASIDHVPGDTPPMQAFVPIGLLSLKAAADRAVPDQDIRVVEINGLINRGQIRNDDSFYENIVDHIWKEHDNFVGLMTDADSLPHTILTAYHLRKRSPQVHICLGGPAVSPISALILERFPFIDSVSRGESELTFCDLLRQLELKRRPANVLGLTWREDSKVKINPERPLIEDVNELPVPCFDAYEMASGAPLYLDVGRGCPFKCRFCATAPFWNRRYRMKTIDRIISEMQLVRDLYGRSHVNFSHDIFTCDKDWTLAFCERLILEPLRVTWSCSTRTDIIDPEVLNKMAKAGCVEIYYGIESGSELTQKDIDKGLDLRWSREIVRATREAGIRPTTGFIVGHPTETMNRLEDTLNRFFEFLEIGGFRAHLFVLCPFHGAPMFREYSETIDRPAEYYDLPLTGGPGQEARKLKSAHLDVFSSSFRFSTRNLPSALVDASEEISCHLVVLKKLWPFVLQHYDSALDWYSRWAQWIESYNAMYRPDNPMRHQGNAYDLLRFVESELSRLGLQNSDVAELASYEESKLDARRLRDPLTPPANGHPLNDRTVLGLRCDFAIRPFRYDLAALLAGQHATPLPPERDTFVIFAKTSPGYVDTLQTGRAGIQLLELSRQPQKLGDLLNSLEVQAKIDRTQSLDLVRAFHGRGLLAEVRDAQD